MGYVIAYEKRAEEYGMKNKKNSNKQAESNSKGNTSNRITIIGIGVTVLIEIIGFSVAFGGMRQEIKDMKELQSTMPTTIANQVKVDIGITDGQTTLAGINQKLDKLDHDINSDGGVCSQLNEIKKVLRLVPIEVNSVDDILGFDATIKNNDITAVTSSNIEPETILGSDSNGVVYIAEDMIGEPLLLVYHEGSKEVYFYGSFNENYHWNGECLINVYNASGLLEVMNESLYDDGKLVSYDIMFVNEKNNMWHRNIREYSEDSRPGETYSYKLNISREKNFTSTNARIMDLMDADDLLEKSEAKLISYYNGNMKNGECNDTSGSAYQVIYYDDGTVKTLYRGNFVDGKYDDSTGNAWDIVYAEDYGFYVYNTGNFKDNKAIEHSVGATSIEEIKNIVSKYSFECELNWKEN